MLADSVVRAGKDVIKSGRVSPKQFSLSPELKNAYSFALAGYRSRELRSIKRALYQRRTAACERDSEVGASPSTVYGQLESVSYFATNFAPNLAAIRHVLNAVSFWRPDWTPQSVLDFGCGVGTGLLGVSEKFGGAQMEMLGVDFSSAQLELAQKFWSQVGGATPEWSPFLIGNEPGFKERNNFDLVLALKSLRDSLGSNRNAFKARVKQLWDLTSDTLIICEDGSPAGYEAVAKARQLVLDFAREEKLIASAAAELHLPQHTLKLENGIVSIGDQLRVSEERLKKLWKDREWIARSEKGAGVVAPCTHSEKCPLLQPERAVALKPNFCRFHARTEAPDTARSISQTKHGLQDDYFSYVVISRGFSHSDFKSYSRLLLQPIKNKGHFHVDWCSSKGKLERATISRPKSSADSLGKVLSMGGRKAAWGDLWPTNLTEGKSVSNLVVRAR